MAEKVLPPRPMTSLAMGILTGITVPGQWLFFFKHGFKGFELRPLSFYSKYLPTEPSPQPNSIFLKKEVTRSGMVAYLFNPRTLEA